jgi:hypothetical protein
MFSSLRQLLPAFLAVFSFSFAACVGTVYDRMYSNKKTYYKAPVEVAKSEVSAEAILGTVETTAPAGGMMPAGDAAAPAGLPPAGGEIPGLPPAPAADPGMAPMTPPAVPPPAVPPAN